MSAAPPPPSPSTPPPASSGLAALEDALRRDLLRLQYPRNDWVRSRTTRDGRPILDVLIIGAGQSGLVTAFALMRDRVTNLLIIDENPPGSEGPWRTFARMKTLRTPKHVTGPDLGIPNLTIEAWYEAQHGPGSWDALGLIPKGMWADYLEWYRGFLSIPVRNHVQAGPILWLETERCFHIPADTPDGPAEFLARKVVLATGIDGSGYWSIPEEVARALPKSLYAHTREEIDFEALRGKRVAVLGAGASAFDNASVALETGAAEVHMLFRRAEVVRVNPYRWAEFTGFLKHHADLPDPLKWRFVNQLCRMGQLPPSDTYDRATCHPNCFLHPGTCIEGFETGAGGSSLRVRTPDGVQEYDFLIVGTGFTTDLSVRAELRQILPCAALWGDRYAPPPDEANDDLARHPYLGPHFELTEKSPGSAPWISGVFNYTFGCLVSMGLGGASISGMKYSVPRLVAGITAQLYTDNAEEYFRSLCRYDVAEIRGGAAEP